MSHTSSAFSCSSMRRGSAIRIHILLGCCAFPGVTQPKGTPSRVPMHLRRNRML